MSESTERLKSLLNISSPPTALEQQVETEVTTQASVEETLRLLSERLSALPDNAYDDIRPIAYQLKDIVTEIRLLPPEKFDENQESLRICLQLAAACCIKLLNQSPIPPKSFACIESTKNMFIYYSRRCKPDRNIMWLHGRFLDRVGGVEGDLESLITDSAEGQALEEHASTPRLTDKKIKRVAEEVTLSSYEALNTQWKKLAGKRKPRSTTGQIKGLAFQISKQVHQLRQDRSEQKKLQLLTLGLAVETRHIQQMEQTNKPLDAISNGLKRAAQYCYSLSQYHRVRGEGDLADKMQLQYLLTAERAENLSGILACRNVIYSDKTTAIEKERAVERERKFHSEKPDNTSDLCEQYFERYVNAKEHLNKVQFKLLEIIQYDQLILSYNALDEDHEQEIPLEVQGRLFDLFETEAVQELQGAIDSYYEVKCDYYDSVEQIHHTVESIRTLRFRAEFQRQAYVLLFERYTNSEAPDDPALFIRNCHGILDEKAKSYSTPLLNAMVRQQLDIWSVEMPDPDDVSEHSESEAHHAQEKPASRTRRFRANTKKASKTVEVAPSVEEDETIWEKLSAAHQVCVIDFYSVIDKIEQDNGLNEATADELYAAITAPDKHLVINEDEGEAYYYLYNQLRDYFTQKEKEALNQLIRERAENLNLGEAIPDEKLLAKSIATIKHMLKDEHEHLLSAEQKANLLFKLGDLYVHLQSLSPKPKFKEEGKKAFKRLKVMIDELPENTAKKWHKFDLDTAISKLTPASSTHHKVLAARAFSEEDLQKQVAIANKTKQQTQDADSHHKEAIKYAALHTFFIEIYQIIRFSTPSDNITMSKIAPFQLLLKDIVQQYGGHFNVHLHALESDVFELSKQTTTELDADTYLSQLKQFYEYLLTGYAKVSDITQTGVFLEENKFENERDAAYERHQSQLQGELDWLSDEIRRLGDHTPLPKACEQTLDRSTIISVEIPELKHKSIVAEKMLACIEDKQYIRAMALSIKSDCKQGLFIRAGLIKWLLEVISTEAFQKFLSKKTSIQTSYDDTKQVLRQCRVELLNASRKHFASKKQTALAETCKNEVNRGLSNTKMETPLRTLSLFSSDGETRKSDTREQTSDQKMGG